MKKIVIVGGGISGLTAAYLLMKGSPELDITVIESEDRIGGKIWSHRVDGFLCEKGPNGFLDNKPRTLELCESLSLEPVRSNENAKKRFIVSKGMLNALPESPLSFIKSGILSPMGKLRLLYELIAPKGPEDETVADFITRRLGREALDKLIDPMCSGIYAGDPFRMSMKNCFPRIKELEQEYGSLIRAMIKIKKQRKAERAAQKTGGEATVSAAPGGTLTSFHDGAQTFTDRLAEVLGDRVKLGQAVSAITKKNETYTVHAQGESMEADCVVLATPAYAASLLVQELDRDLSRSLSDIPYPHVAVVCFGYREDQIEQSLQGFGFLVPHIEHRKILGTLWDSSVFPNRAAEGHALLRSMVGGAKSPELEAYKDEQLISTVFDELKPIMGLKKDPEMVKVYRWGKAIPQYLVSHSRTLQSIDSRLEDFPGLYLTGNAYRGIGINDCIANSYSLSETILASLE